MARTEMEQLVFKMDADLAAMNKKLARLTGETQKSTKQVQKQFDDTGETISGRFTSAIEDAASAVPILGDELIKLGGPVALAAAAGLAGLAFGLTKAKEAMDWADETQATADKIGITAEQLQKLQFAAGDADVEVSAMEEGIKNLNAALGAMLTGVGSGKIEKVFKALKIDKDDLKGMNNASDLMPLLADRLAAVGSKAEQVQLAKRLGIEALLPMLENGGDKLREMGDAATELGQVIDNETTAKLADLSREVEIAQKSIDVQLKTAFVSLAPAIAGSTKAMADFLTMINQLDRKLAILQGAPRTRAEIGKDIAATLEEQRRLAAAFLSADSEKARFGLSQSIKGNQAKLGRLGRELVSLGAEEVAAPAAGTPDTATGGGDKPGKSKLTEGMRLYQSLRPEAERLKAQYDEDVKALKALKLSKDELDKALEQLEYEYKIGSKTIVKPAAIDDPASLDPLDTQDGKEVVQSVRPNGQRTARVVDRGNGDISTEFEPVLNQVSALEQAYYSMADAAEYSFARAGGSVEDFAGIFINELRDMAAAYAASKIGAFLFGDRAADGSRSGGLLSGLFDGIGNNANGTDYWKGGLTWVGERGPEIVNLPRGAGVIPNHDLRGAGYAMRSTPTIIAPLMQLSAGSDVVSRDWVAGLNAQLKAVQKSAVNDALRQTRRSIGDMQASYAKLGT